MIRLHFPCCCGGLHWTVTHEFCGSGITEHLRNSLLPACVCHNGGSDMKAIAMWQLVPA